jgi:hypothetical protein
MTAGVPGTVHTLCDACRRGDCDRCAGDEWVDYNDGLLGGHHKVCPHECHVPDSTDRHYAAQYAYAAGYRD